jgi:hypothetical protein
MPARARQVRNRLARYAHSQAGFIAPARIAEACASRTRCSRIVSFLSSSAQAGNRCHLCRECISLLPPWERRRPAGQFENTRPLRRSGTGRRDADAPKVAVSRCTPLPHGPTRSSGLPGSVRITEKSGWLLAADLDGFLIRDHPIHDCLREFLAVSGGEDLFPLGGVGHESRFDKDGGH